MQEAAQLMLSADAGVVPVQEGDRLVGLVSIGDLTKLDDEGQAAEAALAGVSQEGGQHNHSQEG